MKKLAIALIALALFACGVLVGRYQTFPFRFISDTAMWATGNKGFDYYSDRKTLIETSERTAAVVMLGDSITAQCDWPLLLPGVDVINHGINSDKTAGIKARTELTMRAMPKLVFLMIGVNDISHATSPADVYVDYQAILAAITPSAKVVAQSILPTSDEVWNAKIANTNKHIADSCAAFPGCEFVDLTATILPKRHTTDGLHLSTLGCQSWANRIAPIIARVLTH